METREQCEIRYFCSFIKSYFLKKQTRSLFHQKTVTSASHSNDDNFHQRGSKFEKSSSIIIDGKNSRKRKPSLLIVPVLAAMRGFAVNMKGKIVLTKVTTSRIPHHLALGSHT